MTPEAFATSPDAVERLLADEEWRPVPGWEVAYEVSNWGRVRSKTRTLMVGRPGQRLHKGRVMRPKAAGSGYLAVGLSWEGRVVNKYVHRLVAHAFLGPPPAGIEVNHRNGDKTNNDVANLEYATSSGNKNHAFRNGLRPTKLTEADVREIRTRIHSERQSDLAREFGVYESTISAVVRRRTWRHVD